ncbi:MAG: MBL fold metallo-hydrolase, partial [Gemmataceae bacterium]
MVSGSMHLLEASNAKILLDCGLYQGRREEARERNSHFPFHPQQVDAVIVSHAHIDHCGNLPTLVRQGFSGPIYATPATRDLIRVMLRDSAKIQEEDAAHLNIARNYAEPWVQPLYTHSDVEQALRQIVAVPYAREGELGRGIKFTFSEAGHILGSAAVHIRCAMPDRPRTLTFSGDLGRRGMPILKDPAPLPPADLLICESTYGNRVHEPLATTVEKLYEVVKRTVARDGKLLIPAFSLGRTQLIVHLLQKGLRDGRIPRVPIYVDSPLATDVVE